MSFLWGVAVKKLGPLNKNISIFHNVCIEVLEKYAPEKQKYVRGNQANFTDSKLNHAIMLSSKLRDKFPKSRSNKDREAYKKQRIYPLVCCIRIKKITLKL